MRNLIGKKYLLMQSKTGFSALVLPLKYICIYIGIQYSVFSLQRLKNEVAEAFMKHNPDPV